MDAVTFNSIEIRAEMVEKRQRAQAYRLSETAAQRAAMVRKARIQARIDLLLRLTAGGACPHT